MPRISYASRTQTLSCTTSLQKNTSNMKFFSVPNSLENNNPLSQYHVRTFPKILHTQITKFLTIPDLIAFSCTDKELKTSLNDTLDKTEAEISQSIIPYLKTSDINRTPQQIISAFKNFSNLNEPELLFKAVSLKLLEVEECIPILKLFIMAAVDLNTENKSITALHSSDYGRTALHTACGTYCSRTEIVQYLVAYGANITVKDKDGETALHLAVENGKTEIVKLLLEYKADVTAKNGDGKTALHLAAVNGKTEIVQLLLQYEADVTAKDRYGDTPLHKVIQDNRFFYRAKKDSNTKIVELLLKKSTCLNTRGRGGKTTLHLAVEEQDTEIVKILLNNQADITAIDDCGNTALYYAAYGDNIEIVELLLKKGADVTAENNNKATALHAASSIGSTEEHEFFYGNPNGLSDKEIKTRTEFLSRIFERKEKIVELLLQYHADVNSQDKDGNTPLHFAATHGKSTISKLLLKYHADATVKNKDDQTPLHYASQHTHGSRSYEHPRPDEAENNRTIFHKAIVNGKTEIVKLLVQYYANVATKDKDGKTALHAKDKGGKTALHYAASEDNTEIVKLLLEYRSDVTAKDANDKTALHIAAYWAKTELVKLLLEYRSDVTAKDANDKTALHYAASKDNTEIVKLLLEYRSDVTAKDANDKTALHIAAYWAKTELVKLLLEYRSDVTAKDADGNTALHIGVYWGNTEIVELLLKYLLKYHDQENLNSQNKDGNTALHLAVLKNTTYIVRILLANSVDISLKNKDGYTAFRKATQLNQIEIINLFKNALKIIKEAWAIKHKKALSVGISNYFSSIFSSDNLTLKEATIIVRDEQIKQNLRINSQQ